MTALTELRESAGTTAVIHSTVGSVAHLEVRIQTASIDRAMGCSVVKMQAWLTRITSFSSAQERYNHVA